MKPDRFIIDHNKLKSIWLDKGSHPQYHDHVKNKLKEQWPLLYTFIDEIVTYPFSQ